MSLLSERDDWQALEESEEYVSPVRLKLRLLRSRMWLC
jgi:hypothetical protein